MKFIIAIFGFFIILSAGFFITVSVYNNQINDLQQQIQETTDDIKAIKQELNISDARIESDKQKLELMFESIFTFDGIDSFRQAKRHAVELYKLPSDFVNIFYDETELDVINADTMLEVLCEYNNSDLIFLDKSDGLYAYACIVNLSLVRYDNPVDLLLFFEIDEDGNIPSFVYYKL